MGISPTADEKTRYSAICRVSQWDASGCNAIQFWLQPDGSGRKFTVQLNIAGRTGRNIHDLWQTDYFPAKGETNERVVAIPFALLEHNVKFADSPDTSPVFKPEALIEIAFYVGLRGMPGDGAHYLDDIKAVRVEGLDDVKPPARVALTDTNDLVAAWNFDEPSGLQARDVSVHDLHGLRRVSDLSSRHVPDRLRHASLPARPVAFPTPSSARITVSSSTFSPSASVTGQQRKHRPELPALRGDRPSVLLALAARHIAIHRRQVQWIKLSQKILSPVLAREQRIRIFVG